MMACLRHEMTLTMTRGREWSCFHTENCQTAQSDVTPSKTSPRYIVCVCVMNEGKTLSPPQTHTGRMMVRAVVNTKGGCLTTKCVSSLLSFLCLTHKLLTIHSRDPLTIAAVVTVILIMIIRSDDSLSPSGSTSVV